MENNQKLEVEFKDTKVIASPELSHCVEELARKAIDELFVSPKYLYEVENSAVRKEFGKMREYFCKQELALDLVSTALQKLACKLLSGDDLVNFAEDINAVAHKQLNNYKNDYIKLLNHKPTSRPAITKKVGVSKHK